MTALDMIQPDYSQIQQLLVAQRSLAEAAEAHGTLTGCLCGASAYRFEDWVPEILPEGHAAPEALAMLRELYAVTAGALLRPDMEFELLLPADAAPIALRTTALAQWCQGFLYGLGAGAMTDASTLPGEVGELVRDLVEITRASVDTRQDAEVERERVRRAGGVRARRRAAAVRRAGRRTPAGGGARAAALKAPWRETSSRAAAAS